MKEEIWKKKAIAQYLEEMISRWKKEGKWKRRKAMKIYEMAKQYYLLSTYNNNEISNNQ